MARIFTKLERMFPFLFRRKILTLILVLFLHFLLYKSIIFITSRPKLYDVSVATLKKDAAIMNNRQDNSECSLRLFNVNSYIALLRVVVIDPKKSAKGRSNDLKLQKGFFSLSCTGDQDFSSSILYSGLSHFDNWAWKIVVTSSSSSDDEEIDIVEGLSFAVKRRNSNAYERIIDVYNTYVTARMLRQVPKDSNIVFLDTYPQEDSDALWDVAFGESIRFEDIHRKIKFERLIWTVPAKLGPIESLDLPIPYLEDFRHHMVTFGGAVTSDEVSCQNLHITLITSPDDAKVTKGITVITNTADITQRLKMEFPKHELTVFIPSEVGIRQLIPTIAKTDILIGGHGYDLTNVIFQHKGSGLIELFPTYNRVVSDKRYRNLAEWSNVYYLSWYNMDLLFKDKHQMAVSPDAVVNLVEKMRQRICP